MVMKYNPVTNRFENQPQGIAGLDNPPAGTVEGQFYIDQKTGQYKQRGYNTGLNTPDTVVSSVTVPQGQRNKPASYAPIVPVAGAKATANWQPTEPVGTGQVVKTKMTNAAGKTPVQGRSGVGAKGTAAPTQEQFVSTQDKDLVSQAIADLLGIDKSKLDNMDDNTLFSLAQKLDATQSTSGSGSGASKAAIIKAQTAADAAKATRAAAKKGAGILQKSGEQTQAAYNKLGEQAYNDITARGADYYSKAQKQATGNIDAATADFLKNLIAPTAYSNAPVAQLTPAQQSLMQNLQSYGASGGLAGQQMKEDVANNDFLAGLMRSSNQGLQSAESDYFNSLKNAAGGAQAAAKQNLAGIITSLQGQTQTDAERLRREYLQKGIEALLSGQTSAANMLATNG